MAAPLARKLSKFDFGCTTIRLFRNCLKNGCKHDRSFNTRELKKFYKNATITQSDGWFEVNLDQRKLRTPCGNLFRVPNEALALAVATEWNSQKKIINRHNMHLTSLCNTALDNPMHKTRDTLISSILHFLETDTVSFFIKEPPELYRLQKEHWGPMIQMVEER
ncbi:hypothetical protein DPMN_035650 [Dreissena polymorpha]|uniref:ATP synthase mitochondrial F1 complex assembly factor 2 n=3 Tax=Dreissena polymorpha TaxID=45954 RepID=A0A9D4M9Y5_DREPO|nr:hypothetical protein DPMN_035650 [Dreissena polymorpha]